MAYNGNILREAREARHISQRKLAEISKVNHKTISNIEIGKTDPDFETLRKLAEGLGIPQSELLGEQVSAPREESKNDNMLFTSLSDVFITLEKYAKQPLTEKDKKAFKQILNIIAEKYLDD